MKRWLVLAGLAAVVGALVWRHRRWAREFDDQEVGS